MIKLPKNLAFTLVELLVVVSIISLLISIVTPSLTQARREARVVACMSNQRQVGIAFEIYSEQFDYFWPYPVDAAGGDQYWHRSFLFPMLYPGEPTDTADMFTDTAFACPNFASGAHSNDSLTHGFGMNVAIDTDGTDRTANYGKFLVPVNIRNASQTAVTLDNETPLVWYQDGATLEAVSGRHDGETVVGYADTRADRIQTERLYFNGDPELDKNDVVFDVFWLGK